MSQLATVCENYMDEQLYFFYIAYPATQYHLTSYYNIYKILLVPMGITPLGVHHTNAYNWDKKSIYLLFVPAISAHWHKA